MGKNINKHFINKFLLVGFIFVFLISFSSATKFGYNIEDPSNYPNLYSDNEFYGDNIFHGNVTIQNLINQTTLNVNNSQYLQGLTPQQVADLFDDSHLVPYTGATSNVDLGTYDLTAGSGYFNGDVTAYNPGATTQFVSNADDNKDATFRLRSAGSDRWSLFRKATSNDFGIYNHGYPGFAFYIDYPTNYVGVNTALPASQFHTLGTGRFTSQTAGEVNVIIESTSTNLNGANIQFRSNQGVAEKTGRVLLDNNGNMIFRQLSSGSSMYFDSIDSTIFRGSSYQTIAKFLDNGNILVGTTTDNGYKLQVNGTTLLLDKLAFTQTDGNEYIDSLADGYMDYRATTAHRFGDGTNYTEIKNDGEINLHGTARVYKQIQIPLGAVKAPGTNPPTLVERGLNGAYAYSASIAQTSSTVVEIRYDIDTSQGVTLQVAWGSPETTGVCRWKLEYLYRAEGEDLSTTTPDGTLYVNAEPDDTTADGMVVTEFTIPAPSTGDRGLWLRLTRDAAHEDDTMSGIAYTYGGSIKYVSDKLGTAL